MTGHALKWRRLGKLFDPARVDLPGGCREFAQSPQALPLEDRIRIFFSSRTRDPLNGKYLSHVLFVDMSKDLGEIIDVCDKPVIGLGGPGCFDEHGIFPMNVLHHNGQVYGYTCGWSRRVSVSVDTAIGLAISRDLGRSFNKTGTGPIMGASLHEPFLVGDPFVKVFDGRFHMWYIFGTAWKRYTPGAEPDRTYKIGHAVSDDGVNWRKEEARPIVADRLDDDESQALPTVVKLADRYYMYFCYRRSSDFRVNPERGYRLGAAFSDDLVDWTRDDSVAETVATPSGWDADMQCYPHLFSTDEATFLLYNGNEFGRHGFGGCVLE